jgi:hypothetical protein
MMTTCPACGFEGPAGARFCRQCGSPLFVEREINLSVTRQQEFSQPWEGGYASSSSPDTSRFARQAVPAGGFYTVPTPRSNSHAFWTLTGSICAVATCGLIVASLLSVRPERVRPSFREAISSEIRGDLRREAERTARQAEELARVSAERARTAAEIARAAGEVAKAKGGTAHVADVFPVETLIYPQATVTNRISAGNEAVVLKLETSDDLAQVREFYASRLGDPRIAGKSRLTFAQSDRGVDVVVKIGPSETKGKLEISIARSGPKAQ